MSFERSAGAQHIGHAVARASTSSARLVSINVGLPREVRWGEELVRTAIYKEPVAGRRWVSRLNVEGDGQADLIGHGGEHRAVYVYDEAAMRFWAQVLGRSDLGPGSFGENFTVSGMEDDAVCVGDVYAIGEAIFEVTQPRVTCFKIGRRLGEPSMPALMYRHGRPGFYLRVLREGALGAGDAIEKLADGPGQMTVREISALLYLPGHDPRRLERALEIPALPEGWRKSFEALLASGPGAGNAGLAGATTAPAWPGFREFAVAEVRRESAEVRSFLLAPRDADPLPDFAPGASVSLRLSHPDLDAPLIRSYSLSRAHDPRCYRISVKRLAQGAASGFLHERLRAGDVVELAAPRGSFSLDAGGDSPVVLLSAGIGITPVLAMLDALARGGSPRPVWWLHGARSGEELVFAGEVGAALARLPNSHSRVWFSRPGPADELGTHFDCRGRLGAEQVRAAGAPQEAEHYLCGPDAFMRELAAGLLAHGVARERIHQEAFGPAATNPDLAPHPPADPTGDGPEVHFARSSLTVAWDPRFGSLLELAEACDVPASWSCRTGACHRCESGLIEGEVSYVTEPLEAAGPGNVLICSAQPATEITLDL